MLYPFTVNNKFFIFFYSVKIAFKIKSFFICICLKLTYNKFIFCKKYFLNFTFKFDNINISRLFHVIAILYSLYFDRCIFQTVLKNPFLAEIYLSAIFHFHYRDWNIMN